LDDSPAISVASCSKGARNDQIFGEWFGHSEEQLAIYRSEGVIS
jgi:hypothetical protein